MNSIIRTKNIQKRKKNKEEEEEEYSVLIMGREKERRREGKEVREHVSEGKRATKIACGDPQIF